MSECLLNTGEMDTNKHSPNGTIDGVTNLSKILHLLIKSANGDCDGVT